MKPRFSIARSLSAVGDAGVSSSRSRFSMTGRIHLRHSAVKYFMIQSRARVDVLRLRVGTKGADSRLSTASPTMDSPGSS
jgi:hypothetical protein